MLIGCRNFELVEDGAAGDVAGRGDGGGGDLGDDVEAAGEEGFVAEFGAEVIFVALELVVGFEEIEGKDIHELEDAEPGDAGVVEGGTQVVLEERDDFGLVDGVLAFDAEDGDFGLKTS